MFRKRRWMLILGFALLAIGVGGLSWWLVVRGRSFEAATLTFDGAGHFQAGTPGGRNLHFGIREHAMGAIVNGLSLSKLRGFGASFFVFIDYARPALRLRDQGR